jgi:hypothetical protein
VINKEVKMMNIATLERAIVIEARKVSGRKELRMKDLQEWAIGEVSHEAGEVVYVLPKLVVQAAFLDGKKKG